MAVIQYKNNDGQGRRTIDIFNPDNRDFLYEIECQTPDEVEAIIHKAREAQKSWAALPVKQRVQYFYKLRDVILARRDDIISTVVKETGKPVQDALTMEVFATCAFITYWCQQAGKTLRDETFRAPGLMGLMKKVHMTYKPLGVVGVIAPWNGPFVLTANPCIQAMIAGNAVVAKGSEITPFSSRILEDLCREAGIPDGVCNVLIGDGETGAALTRGGVDKISFTGSVATGKKVGMACLESLIPFTLELGGKDAMIVCDDADLDKAAHGAVWGGCINTGHYCCGVERIYVHESVYDRFVGKVVELTKSLKQGKQYGYDEDVGAVFWDKQYEIIRDHVQNAVDHGARVLAGGPDKADPSSLYYPPTVMVDVDESSPLMRDETFGPVLPIIKFRSIDEAVEKANASHYGLHGSVWTKDKHKGLEIARKIKTGSMSVNDIGIMYGIPNAPFGGVKESGIGAVNGEKGLRGYTHAMPIVVGQYRGEDSGYPHDKTKFDQMNKLMDFLWKSFIGRLFFD